MIFPLEQVISTLLQAPSFGHLFQTLLLLPPTPPTIFPLSHGFAGGSDGKEFCLPMQKTQVQSLGREDPLEKEMATHSNILA